MSTSNYEPDAIFSKGMNLLATFAATAKDPSAVTLLNATATEEFPRDQSHHKLQHWILTDDMKRLKRFGGGQEGSKESVTEYFEDLGKKVYDQELEHWQRQHPGKTMNEAGRTVLRTLTQLPAEASRKRSTHADAEMSERGQRRGPPGLPVPSVADILRTLDAGRSHDDAWVDELTQG